MVISTFFINFLSKIRNKLLHLRGNYIKYLMSLLFFTFNRGYRGGSSGNYDPYKNPTDVPSKKAESITGNNVLYMNAKLVFMMF